MHTFTVLLTVAVLGASSLAQTKVTNSTSSPREPFIAVNPTNQKDLIVVYTTNAGIGYSHTTDGGATDPKTGEEEILAVAGEPTVSFDRAILSIEGMTVNKISDTPISYDLFSVWFVPEKHYYVAGDGIYEKDLLSDSLWTDSVQQITTYYTTCVRGNGVNDVFIAGAFGELLHWDGASWKSFKDQTSLSNGSYSGVAVHGNLVIAVGGNLAAGDIDSKAVVTMGRR